MRYYRLLLCALLFASLLGVVVLHANTEVKQRKFEFTYTTTVQVPEGAHSASLWLPLPNSDVYQDISELRIKTDYPISFHTDAEYNNSVLFVSVDSPKPGPLVVEMSCQVVRREHVH